MSKTGIVAALVAALVLALALGACDGGSGSSSTKTPSQPTATTAAPTATTIPVAVPNKPLSFSDYPSVIAQYLDADPAAAGAKCLDALFTAWNMPLISAADGCRAANTDEDPEDEVVVVLTNKLAAATATTDTQFDIVVFDASPGGYVVAFQAGPNDILPPGRTQAIKPLLAAGDLNNDGGGELAFATGNCGASTCFTTVHILKGIAAAGYVTIAPPDGITMPTADANFQPGPGDTQELLLSGGVQGSVGAGPQRTRTETWAWNGTAYALKSTQLDKATYLYHAVKDADTLFAASKYSEAEAAYAVVVGDTSLQIWDEAKGERNELESYSLFRAALAVLEAGGDAATANGYLDRSRSYHPETLHDQLAGSFEAGYNAKNSISVGCAAVRDDVQANLAEYQAFWDFGYTNPPFDPAIICPF